MNDVLVPQQALLTRVSHYLSSDELHLVQLGIDTAVSIHDSFYRKNGEPYINHVIAVATTLAEWHAPAPVLVAALLHDIYKSNYANSPTPKSIETRFGTGISALIVDIARLGRLGPVMASGQSSATRDATVQMPWVAMVLQRSPLAVVVKLADKLHNFQSLSVLSQERQQAYAASVLSVFVPFAERLGMRQVKRQLADHAFRILQPALFDELLRRYPLQAQQTAVSPLIETLKTHFQQHQFNATITITPRSIHDLHLLETTNRGPLPWTALQVIIILTEGIAACYQAIGLVHQLWTPQPGKLMDYIGAPKANGYRALHTRVHLPSGELQTIVMREPQIDLVADMGLTAQWRGVPDKLLPEFSEWLEPPPGKITVLTPDGDLKLLPEGATPVDFAYHLHLGLGHQCMGALVNGRQLSLSHALETGDVIQILTGKTSVGPSADWLSFVKTPRARSAIRRWHKSQKPQDAADKGWAILETHLYRQRIALSFAQAATPLTAVAETFGYPDKNGLLVAIALKQKTPTDVIVQLAQRLDQSAFSPEMQATVSSLDDANLPQRLARCCRPVPPDPIVGYVTKENRITIHRADCVRVQALRPQVHADWNDVNVQFRTEIGLQCVDRPGLVRDVSVIVSESGTNMTNFHADRLDGGTAYIEIGLGDIPRSQRERLVAQLKQVQDVEQVSVRVPGSSSRFFHKRPLPILGGNPYTLRPVTGDSFFGRRSELRELINHLRSVQPGEAVLLWGPRRIGKTSLLLQFQQNIMNGDDYVLGFLDMQRLSGRSTTMFLRDIIHAVLKPFDSPREKAPNLRNMRRDPLGYFRSFIEHNPLIQNKHLVLILDEFQLLATLTEDYVSLADINRYFRSLIQHRGGLSIIFSGGGVLDKLLAQPETSFMLEVARHQKVGCLTESDARQLIVEPSPRVQFEEPVVQQLLELTAGHPYYLQWLCGELVAEAARQESGQVMMTHLSHLLAAWLPQQGAQFFNHLWGSASGFNQQQQAMGLALLTAVAHQPSAWVSFETVADTLAQQVSRDALWLTLQSLTKIDTLVMRNQHYSFRVPLVAIWIQNNYRLEDKR